MLVLHMLVIFTADEHIIKHVFDNARLKILVDCQNGLLKLRKLQESLFLIVFALKRLYECLTIVCEVFIDELLHVFFLDHVRVIIVAGGFLLNVQVVLSNELLQLGKHLQALSFHVLVNHVLFITCRLD